MSRCLENVLQTYGKVLETTGGLSDVTGAAGSLGQPPSHREAM